MAEATKPAKKRRTPVHLAIERRYMLDKSERVRGRDGKTYEIFHAIGPARAHSKMDFFDELGFKDELRDVEKDAQKRYKSLSDVRSVVEGRKAKLMSVLNSRIHACKNSIARLYRQGPNKLIPLMASVPMPEERKLYIQGFVNTQGEFVIGSRDDAALWAIEVLNSTRGLAEKHKLAHSMGKDLVHRISGPVKERLAQSLKS